MISVLTVHLPTVGTSPDTLTQLKLSYMTISSLKECMKIDLSRLCISYSLKSQTTSVFFDTQTQS